ncbi:hypothetical protein CP97_14743 [Aurantiacibacter atlanticus]|uniref:Uncharacterized protein n=1 Tax=Aurantiacibacter atlanticus TaxID=1648404 RepID=A0A161J4B0_9SPHN|nr:hypothetical protein CP97_14743 [Aurantiacibacter atlanticus]
MSAFHVNLPIMSSRENPAKAADAGALSRGASRNPAEN